MLTHSQKQDTPGDADDTYAEGEMMRALGK